MEKRNFIHRIQNNRVEEIMQLKLKDLMVLAKGKGIEIKKIPARSFGVDLDKEIMVIILKEENL